MRAAPNRTLKKVSSDVLKTILGSLLWCLEVFGLIGAAVFVIILVEILRDKRCPYCAREWALRKRGDDLVCRRCARDIDRRIRATADDPVPSRPRLHK